MPTDDYIKREDALKVLCDKCVFEPRCTRENEFCNQIQGIKAIPAADVEPKQKWISVKSDKPKEDGKYFVLRHSQGRPIVEIMYYGIPEYLKDRHFYFYDSEWGDVVVGDVTHWLPLSALPEPPKGGRRW